MDFNWYKPEDGKKPPEIFVDTSNAIDKGACVGAFMDEHGVLNITHVFTGSDLDVLDFSQARLLDRAVTAYFRRMLARQMQ